MLFPTATFAIFFLARAAALVAADAEARALAPLHRRRQLRLLRLVGLALRLPPRRLHRLEPRARPPDPPRRTGPRGGGCSSSRCWATSACSPTSSTTSFGVSSAQNLASLARRRPLAEIRSVVLPVGISFYTFMGISYVVDTYRGEHGADDDRPRRGLPRVLPAPRRRPDRAPERAAAADRRAARRAEHRRRPRLLPDRDRALQEGRDREPPRRRASSTPSSARPASTRRPRSRSRCTPTRCRSTPTSAATRTSRSASRCSSASRSRRTSTRRTPPSRCRTSGTAGT